MSATCERGSVCSVETGRACGAGPDVTRAILGGFVGTVALTLMMYFIAPLMMGMKMDIAGMLGSLLGDSWWAGLGMHFLNGTIIFPLIYAFVLYGVFLGGPTLKGITWGVILWVLAQVVVMPMMGAGLFSANAGGLMAAMGSLLGHLVYGGLLGFFAGSPRVARA